MGEISGQFGTTTPEDEQPVVLPKQFGEGTGVAPNEDVARWLRRQYPSGVAVVTAVYNDDYLGVTVSAFTYVSLDPLLLLVALGNESQTGEQIRASGAFGVSMLTNKHRFLADRFAGRAPLVDRKFVDVPYLTATTGSPLLSDSIAWIDCRLESCYPGGDHHLYVGEAVATGHGTGDETDPLIYFDSSYRRVR
jgi:3-hydroxy-9,10-secoandrosta-1,3,5(10)-triene-9,17-dione monooxygenase reductase component